MIYGTNSRLSRSNILPQMSKGVDSANSARTMDDEHGVAALPAVEGHATDRLTKLFRNVSNPYKFGNIVLILRPHWRSLPPSCRKVWFFICYYACRRTKLLVTGRSKTRYHQGHLCCTVEALCPSQLNLPIPSIEKRRSAKKER